MSSNAHSLLPGRPPPGQDAVVPRLIGISSAEFASRHWGSEPLLTKSENLPAGFEDLLTADAVDELVSRRGLRTPFIRVAKSGRTLPDKAFTASGGVGAGVTDQVSDDKLVALFADGATIVLQGLHRLWPPIIDFCQRLAAELGHPVQANAYVTPPQNKGFSHHYDVHDVFVLQIAGEKEWSIHRPVHEAPLRNQPWNERGADVERAATEPPLLQTVLHPGDCLYLPRGYLHAATALGSASTHLTIGIHTWTRHTLAEQLMQLALERAGDDPELRRSLPYGLDVTEPASTRDAVADVRTRLIASLEQLDADEVSAGLSAKVRQSQRAAPVGPLRQLADADQLQPGTRLSLRPYLGWTVDKIGDDRWMLRSRAGDLSLSTAERAAFDRLATEQYVTAGSLGLDLARRMLLGALVVVAE